MAVIIRCLAILLHVLPQITCTDIELDVSSDSKSFPPGHLQPLGSHGPPVGSIPELEIFPDPYEFFKEYVRKSRPFVVRGGARNIPAYSKWNDDYLKEQFKELVVGVEMGKKENRSNGFVEIKFEHFLELYTRKDIYMVHNVAHVMREDLGLPRSLQLGGFQKAISAVLMWFSSGGTKSVLHFDQQDNINCLMDGSKRIVFIDETYKEVESIGWREDASFSNINVEKVDMLEFPQFADIPYYEITLEKGDCTFIPVGWYHHVDSSEGRNLAVNIWFEHLMWFDEEEYENQKSNLRELEPLSMFVEGSVQESESMRRELFNPFIQKEVLLPSDVEDFWTNEMGYADSNKVFNIFDENRDGILTWPEIYRLGIVELQGEFEKIDGAPAEEMNDTGEEEDTEFSKEEL